jgi:hypothetical protein
VAIAGTRVPTVERPCFRITTSPEPANFFGYPEHLHGCPSISGRPCLSSLGDLSSKHHWIMSLLNLSRAIGYAKSTSIAIQQYCKLKNFGQQCRFHSRSSQFSICQLKTCRTGQFFPIHSWVDLRHVFDTSPCLPSHFRDCRIYCCPPLALSTLHSLISLILATFHPRRWLTAFPY